MVNRIQPTGPAQLYQTYGASTPLATHFRAVSCEEFGCEAYTNGWVTRVPIGSASAEFITSGQTRRRYRETTGLESAEREFMFEPGQPCFRSSEHRVPLDRPAIYTRRPGDWRNLGGRGVTFSSAEAWRDDLGENQERIADLRERG